MHFRYLEFKIFFNSGELVHIPWGTLGTILDQRMITAENSGELIIRAQTQFTRAQC